MKRHVSDAASAKRHKAATAAEIWIETAEVAVQTDAEVPAETDTVPAAAAEFVKVKEEVPEQPVDCDEETPQLAPDLGPHSIIEPVNRQLAALESGYLSDVAILVGDEAIKCHSVIVSFASPKLAAIVKENEPRLPDGLDVDPPHFRLLLQIIYSGNTKEPQDVASLLQVGQIAHKLEVATAVAYCASSLTKKLTAENLWRILDFADLIGDEQLEEACFKTIRILGDLILQTDAFINCTIPHLLLLLRQHTLFNVSELQLFQACVSWTKATSHDAERDRRATLKSALHLIRFRTFSVADFAKHVCPTGLLSAEKQSNIFRSLATGENFMPERFSATMIPRDPAGRPIEIRFLPSGEKKPFNKFVETRTRFTIFVNRDIFMLEIGLLAWRSNIPRGSIYNENVLVTLQKKDDDKDKIQKVTCVAKVKNGGTFRVKFMHPFEMIYDTTYTLLVDYSRKNEGSLAYQLYKPNTIWGGSHGLELHIVKEALAPPDLQFIVAEKFTA